MAHGRRPLQNNPSLQGSASLAHFETILTLQPQSCAAVF
jgi:hypothetical protein